MTHYSNTRNPIDFPKKKEIPMLERFAAQSLVPYNGELIFSKEKFAELIVKGCMGRIALWQRMDENTEDWVYNGIQEDLKEHFGIEE